MRVVWDLDGVLRDLNGQLQKMFGGEYPSKWNWDWSGKSVYERINEDLSILYKSPATAYKAVAVSHFSHLEIWTSQPEAWRPNTTRWIDKHIGKCNVKFLFPEDKEEELRKNEDIILIEDSPNFKDYDRILLIDRPYNQEVRGALRIFGTKHLNNMIEVSKDK